MPGVRVGIGHLRHVLAIEEEGCWGCGKHAPEFLAYFLPVRIYDRLTDR